MTRRRSADVMEGPIIDVPTVEVVAADEGVCYR